MSNNLRIIRQTESLVKVQLKESNTQSSAFVRAVFDYSSTYKTLTIAKPYFKVLEASNVAPTNAKAIITLRNPDLIESATNATIEEVSGSGYVRLYLDSYSDHYEVLGLGGRNENWIRWIRFTTTNNCGTVERIFKLEPAGRGGNEGGGGDDPCDGGYVFGATGNNQYTLLPPDNPCDADDSPSDPTLPPINGFSTSVATTESGSNLENKKVTISVYNIYGFRVLRTHKKKVNLSSFKDGFYFLKAKVDGKIYSKKVVKN